MLDLAIRGGRLVDGTGGPWFAGDLGIAGDRIVAVGRLDGPARRTIDADGLVVCPGFIDMHTHSDLQPLAHPRHEMKLHQGVTLDVIGQDGLSLAPARRDTLADLRAHAGRLERRSGRHRLVVAVARPTTSPGSTAPHR